MKSYSAYFIKSEMNDAVRKLFNPVVEVPDSPWLVGHFRKDAPTPDDDVLWGERSLTRAKSEQLGEIIFLCSPAHDSFIYEHANNGVLLRKLVWFPMLDDDWTAGWLCASGEPEEWENILFRPQNLDMLLEEERGIYEERGEDANFPEREKEIRRIWETRTIKEKDTIPRADASVTLCVEKHFGLKKPENS